MAACFLPTMAPTAPSFLNASAMPNPIPLFPPVITATLFSNFINEFLVFSKVRLSAGIRQGHLTQNGCDKYHRL
jgi:hypothetical protein